jgi:hypothetical protein
MFGATIASPMQSATNGSSEEVNQGHDVIADGVANEDASYTSPLELRDYISARMISLAIMILG